MHRAIRILVGTTALSVVLVMMPTVAVYAVGVPTTMSYRTPVTAGPVVPGFPIDHLGVVWDEPGSSTAAGDLPGHGSVRLRHGGAWGPWIPLEKDGASGAGLWASGLVAGDGADAFQVRGIPAGVGAPRTVALNTSDGPLRAGHLVPVGAAALDSDRCRSRAEWGADESLRDRVPANPFPAQVMTLHHTATSNGDTDPAGTVRAIYEYHTVDNGWDDIGYHYLVSEDGTVFEGAWSGQLGATWQQDTYSRSCSEGGDGADFAHISTADDSDVARGAHAGGYNTGNIGIALLGTFTQRGRSGADPQPAAVAAAEQILAENSARHGIDPEGTVDYANEVNQITVDAISGHRDFNATECPGDRLYAMLPQIRADVADLVASPGDSPPSVTVTSPADGAQVSGTVPVVADATDDGGVTRVDFDVDGQPLATDTDGADGWTAAWDTTVVADGAHTVSATATDTSGQTSTHAVGVVVGVAGTVHVGDLDGASTSSGGTWTASVTVAVAANTGGPVAGAEVTGRWSTGDSAGCVTGADGRCTLDLAGIRKRTGSVDLGVTGVAADGLVYHQAANSDPESDSDGTTITVSKP
jgi:hypothetical protein